MHSTSPQIHGTNRNTVLSRVPSSSNTKSLAKKLVSKSNDTVSCWRQQDKQGTLALQPLPFKIASFSTICCCKAANYCISRMLIPREKIHIWSHCSEGRTPSPSFHCNKMFSRKAKAPVAQIPTLKMHRGIIYLRFLVLTSIYMPMK